MDIELHGYMTCIVARKAGFDLNGSHVIPCFSR